MGAIAEINPGQLPALPPGATCLILFDGVCNLCNGLVQFVVKRDPKGLFAFAALQGETGQRLKELVPQLGQYDTVLLLEGNRLYGHSDAALRIAAQLSFPFNLAKALYLLPQSLRDAAYRAIAARRYAWFGKQEECMLPTPELRARFLA